MTSEQAIVEGGNAAGLQGGPLKPGSWTATKQTLGNPSGIEPLGRSVLVEPYEQKAKQGLIVIPDSVKERHILLEQRAVVIALGPLHVAGEDFPRCKPGDHVMISAMAGAMIEGTLDGKQYRLVNHMDIFCKITEKEDGQDEDKTAA